VKTFRNYCRSFRHEAYQVWCDMSEAEGFGLPRNEETTTEELLLSLARKYRGGGLDIKGYTKADESTNGADWAFWFSDGTRKGIGARIQAKRLFGKEGRYKSLFHQSGSQKEASKASGLPTPNQCETLLTYRDGLVPLYVFYNSDALNLSVARLTHAQRKWLRLCDFPFPSPAWGISAASALAVKLANWGMDDRPGDFPMIPWHCIVCACCWEDRSADPSLPALIGHGLRQLYSYGTADRGDDPDLSRDLGFSFEPTDKAPTWVGLLRDSGVTEGLLDEEMSRFNLKGVAILQETEARGE
jgi:hypothetical protein